MSDDPRLTRNAIRCKSCNTIIESKHRHDFVSCPCGAVFVDGGLDYFRAGWPGGKPEDHFENLCEHQ